MNEIFVPFLTIVRAWADSDQDLHCAGDAEVGTIMSACEELTDVLLAARGGFKDIHICARLVLLNFVLKILHATCRSSTSSDRHLVAFTFFTASICCYQ